MRPLPRVTVCAPTNGATTDQLRCCIHALLDNTPAQVELRVGCTSSDGGLHQLLGMMCPDGVSPDHRKLPRHFERFQWTCTDGSKVNVWLAPAGTRDEVLLRELLHDIPVTTDYVVTVSLQEEPEAGWWENTASIVGKGVDLIGRPAWHVYSQRELDAIQNFPWYMGVPFERREGRTGVAYMSPGFRFVRADCLKQANFPEKSRPRPGESVCSSDVLLGEIARQLGWKQEALAPREGKAAAVS